MHMFIPATSAVADLHHRGAESGPCFWLEMSQKQCDGVVVILPVTDVFFPKHQLPEACENQ